MNLISTYEILPMSKPITRYMTFKNRYINSFGLYIGLGRIVKAQTIEAHVRPIGP